MRNIEALVRKKELDGRYRQIASFKSQEGYRNTLKKKIKQIKKMDTRYTWQIKSKRILKYSISILRVKG